MADTEGQPDTPEEETDMGKSIEQRRDELIAQGKRIRDAQRQATDEARQKQYEYERKQGWRN